MLPEGAQVDSLDEGKVQVVGVEPGPVVGRGDVDGEGAEPVLAERDGVHTHAPLLGLDDLASRPGAAAYVGAAVEVAAGVDVVIVGRDPIHTHAVYAVDPHAERREVDLEGLPLVLPPLVPLGNDEERPAVDDGQLPAPVEARVGQTQLPQLREGAVVEDDPARRDVLPRLEHAEGSPAGIEAWAAGGTPFTWGGRAARPREAGAQGRSQAEERPSSHLRPSFPFAMIASA